MSAQQITSQDVDAWHTQMCQALRFGAMLDNFPSMVRRCLELRIWEKRQCRDLGRPFRSAKEYFEHNEPDGVGTDVRKVETLIKDEPETLVMWRKALTGSERQRTDLHNNVMQSPIQGNSRAYTLDRLKRESPVLFARTLLPKKDPEHLSANAAAIRAGIRNPPSPFEQIRKLVPKLTAAEKKKLREMLE